MSYPAQTMIPVESIVEGAEQHARSTGRPLVTLAYAQSLDGSLTSVIGGSYPLSGQQSLILTHRLRAAHDIILVGIGTVLADDPQLTVRLVDGRDPQPVILDSRLRIPLDSRLLCRKSLLPWLACLKEDDATPDERIKKQATLKSMGVRLLKFTADQHGRIPLAELLDELVRLGVRSMMVEGGAKVISSFIAERLAGQAVVTIAPIWLRGLRIMDWDRSPALGFDIPHFESPAYEVCGQDLVVWGKLVYKMG